MLKRFVAWLNLKVNGPTVIHTYYCEECWEEILTTKDLGEGPYFCSPSCQEGFEASIKTV